jgi:AraC-like DNA-binding protein
MTENTFDFHVRTAYKHIRNDHHGGCHMFDSCTYIGGGRIRFRASHHFKSRLIPHHRILFMESGQGIFTFGSMRVSITHGNIYLLAPGTREARYLGDKPVAYDYVEFDSPSRLIDRPCLACRVDEPFRHALTHLLRCIVQDSGPLRRQLLAAAVGLALYDVSAARTADPRLRRVLGHIEEHPERSATVGELAEIAGLSEPQLRRLFHAAPGISPKHFVMRTRMEYARRLIRAEGLRVNEAAGLLGFASPFQFSAQYRKIHGHPPSSDTGGT